MMNTYTSNSVTRTFIPVVAMVAAATLLAFARPAAAVGGQFAPGDVFVALRSGQVQWRGSDGTLKDVLAGPVPGKVEGLGLDAAGNLYVSHYCADASLCSSGNSFEKYNTSGVPQGAWGSGYNCNPYSIVFDGSGRAYVGQANCTGDVLLFNADGALQRSFDPLPENRGTAWVDLAPDGCTLFYTSQGRLVKRYNVCTDSQLPDFNQAPLGSTANQMHMLPDGGVLVATDDAIVRLDASGAQVNSYDVPGEYRLWYGVALPGDGTFWASNYGTSNVYHFDLKTGSVISHFNTGTPTTTVKGLAVMPAAQ